MASNSGFNKAFSAGLGPRGRAASWLVAFAGAGVWIYYENQQQKSSGPLTIEDIKKYNADKKKEIEKKEKS